MELSISQRLVRFPWRECYQLCKPKVVALIVFTAIVGMMLSTDGFVPLDILIFGTLGIGLGAASGAAVNHYVDQRIDAIMERTRNRPLPQGQLTPRMALGFAVFIGVLSMLILYFLVNPLTALLTFIFGFPTAYFIATRPKEKRDLWMLLIIIPFWTNLLIRTFAIMEVIRNEGIVNTGLIALGIIDEPIQMLFTNFAIAVGMVYVYLPLMVLPIYASMEKLDFRLVEAAYDLYATRVRVFFRVIVPLVKPGLIAGSILVFIPTLGAYVTPAILGGARTTLLGDYIVSQFLAARNQPFGSALSMAVMTVMLIATILLPGCAAL